MKKIEIIYPKLDDIRWQLLLVQGTFVAFVLSSNLFTRTVSQAAATLAATLITDSLFLYFKKLPLFPLSGILPFAAITILVDSPTIWVYVLAGSLSVISKHLIRIRNRHIFLPNGFGIIVCAFLFSDYMTITTGHWGGSLFSLLFIGLPGLWIAFKADRILLSFAYTLTFLLGVWVRHEITALPYPLLIAPITGAAFLQFTLFMLTDPVITPKKRSLQLLFGIAVGIVDTYYRLGFMKYAPFFSYLVISGLYSFIEEVFGIERDYPWSLGKFKIGSK